MFSRIVSDIHAGVFRPRDAISERDVVQRFGVSRTPAREAIKRLFARGLLEVGPRRVAIVKEITQKDLGDLYDLRLRLEAEAATLTAKHISDAELANRRAAMEAKGADAWQPVKRERYVSQALQAYAALTTSADRGAVRELSQLKR